MLECCSTAGRMTGPLCAGSSLTPAVWCGYTCPSPLFWLSPLLILAPTSPLGLACVVQRVAASDPPLSLLHGELSPSPPASALPIYKHHGPLLGTASSEGFWLCSGSWLVGAEPQPPSGPQQGGMALARSAGHPALGSGSSASVWGFAPVLGQPPSLGPPGQWWA